MRVLILTCSTGEGHNSVSAAVQEAFVRGGTVCHVMDALSFLSEKASELICRWHTRLYRYAPGAWKVSYKLMEQHPAASEEHNLIVRFLSLGAERLYEMVTENGYDCLICPHVFAGLMVSSMRRQHPELAVSASFIATDYSRSPLAELCDMDWYFVPCPEATEEFLAADIPAERLVTISGVPVREAFYDRTEKIRARHLAGLRPTGRMVLAMCGSMGCGHLDDLTLELAERLPAKDTLAVICGTNSHIQKKLERQCAGRDNIHIWGYRNDMSLLMDCADLYLTKAGGVSTSEAAVKGLPMVLVDAVSACEGPNLRYFCATGGAVTADSPEELTALCLSLLADGAVLEKMSGALLQDRRAADEIWRHLTQAEARRS